MSAHQATYPIATQCRVLGVSPSGYYAWQQRSPSARQRQDGVLRRRIRELHALSRGTYGSPRLLEDLRQEGFWVSRKRIARLMQAEGLRGVSRRKWVTTTRRDEHAGLAPDLVQRRFRADRPDQLWVADITYVPTWSVFLYVAVVLDVWSRLIVGWSMRTDLQAALVTEALDMALARRHPESVIHHSDHGTQYTSIAFGRRCVEAGVLPSMGSVGDCYDNALCESFFATLECELLDRRSFRNPVEARLAVFDYIEGFYNPRRRHSALGQISPMEFEARNSANSPAHVESRTLRFRGTVVLQEPLRGSCSPSQNPS